MNIPRTSVKMLGTFLLLACFLDLSSGHEFVNNVPDGRCKKMGEFLTHPQDRCKYVVCEFGSGKGGYSKEKMYGRVMRCAPGSSVPYVKYKYGQHHLVGTPCTEHYGGKCPARLHVRYGLYSKAYGPYGKSNGPYSKDNGPYYSQRRRQNHHHRRRRYRGYPGKSLRRSRYQYHSQAEPLQSRLADQAKSQSVEYLTSTPDGRCKTVGQFWPHPHDRCKYVVCEFGRNTLTSSVVYNTDKLYGRVMRCAPGTTVANAKYSKIGPNGLTSNPCTEYFGGNCPARASAYHPLITY